MSQGPGGINLQNLSHLHSSITYQFFHASSFWTHFLSLCRKCFYKKFDKGFKTFSPFRGVMKIRIAVTLVVLGLLNNKPHHIKFIRLELELVIFSVVLSNSVYAT